MRSPARSSAVARNGVLESLACMRRPTSVRPVRPAAATYSSKFSPPFPVFSYEEGCVWGAKFCPCNDFHASWLTGCALSRSPIPCNNLRLCSSLCFEPVHVGTPTTQRFHPFWLTFLCVSGGDSLNWLTGGAQSAARARQSSTRRA